MMRDDLEEVERSVGKPSRHADVNAAVGGYLRDLAFAQPTQPKMFGYKRAAAAIFALETPLTELVADDGTLPRIAGIGPGSTRVIREVLVDHTLAAMALGANCIFALDSDAHTTTQLAYTETALAHARLAGIPPERIVNCWPLGRLRSWLSDPSRESSPGSA